jgi:hypothetical protein
MKRFVSVLLLGILTSSSAWSTASPIQVKHHKKDPRVEKHKPHKAAKHKAPKRPHNSA